MVFSLYGKLFSDEDVIQSVLEHIEEFQGYKADLYDLFRALEEDAEEV